MCGLLPSSCVFSICLLCMIYGSYVAHSDYSQRGFFSSLLVIFSSGPLTYIIKKLARAYTGLVFGGKNDP